ncbi:MAG: cytochrome c [Chromatiaceae bacterium]|nr:cytochrome c [Gammaproteobacteria bacterium]MCP5314674.1 cytochrome c [Chromatiaceae bacterium]
MIARLFTLGLAALLSTLDCRAAPPDPGKLSGRALGQYVFLTYCAGCHGFDGLAFFPSAPSFAMGDRLAKSDMELMRSILKGRNAMPSWEDKLPLRWLEEALAYIRHVAFATHDASSPPINQMPESFFIFAPLGTDMILDWPVDIP